VSTPKQSRSAPGAERSRDGLPAYPSRPFLALRRLREDPIAFLEDLAARGDVVSFSIGSRRAVLLNHPDHVERVLVSDHRAFAKGPAYARARRLLGEGLLTIECPAHRRRRQIVTPAFHRRRLDACAAPMVLRAIGSISGWKDGQSIDVAGEMRRLTLGVVGEALFGEALDADAMSEIRGALGDAIASLDPLLTLVGPARRIGPARRRLEAVVDRLIERRVSARCASRSPHEDDRQDVLSLLLDAAGTEGDGGLARARDDALTLLLAGHDTVASALTWTWLLVAEHPEVETRLHGELDRILGSRDAGAADVPALQYVRGTFAESLRLVPPAWIIARRARHALTIGDTAVPAGGVVVMSPYLMHRDARFFADPLEFRPERWLSAEQGPRPRLAYFPFGAGSRSCVGEPFAWMEGVLALATIARRWRLRPCGPVRLAFEPRVTLQPGHPLLLRAERRA
jgi:cytochrome P450